MQGQQKAFASYPSFCFGINDEFGKKVWEKS
jgi:hypothetical protein